MRVEQQSTISVAVAFPIYVNEVCFVIPMYRSQQPFDEEDLERAGQLRSSDTWKDKQITSKTFSQSMGKRGQRRSISGSLILMRNSFLG